MYSTLAIETLVSVKISKEKLKESAVFPGDHIIIAFDVHFFPMQPNLFCAYVPTTYCSAFQYFVANVAVT